MSNNDLSYLNYIPTVNISSSNSSSGNKSVQSLVSEAEDSIKRFQSNTGFSSAVTDFKRYFKDLLVRDYEVPLSRELDEIKKRRGKNEYKQDVIRVLEQFKKMREETEYGLIDVKRFLDYTEKLNTNANKTRLYLPGIDIKLGKIFLPDILGFTKSDVKRVEYKEDIVKMARVFMGMDKDASLGEAINKVYELIKSRKKDFDKSKDLSLKFCEEFKIRELIPLYKITTYYALIKMLETGEFNYKDFESKKVDNRGNRGDRNRNRDRDRDRDRDRYRNRSRSRDRNRNKKRDRENKRKSFFGGDSGRKIGDMIEYVLRKEGDKFAKDTTDKFLKELKSNGFGFFKNKFINYSDSDFDERKIMFEFVDKNSFKSVFKAKSGKTFKYINKDKDVGELNIQFKNLKLPESFKEIYDIGMTNYNNAFVSIRDFYTGIIKNEENPNKGTGSSYVDLKAFYAVYDAYREYYRKYTFERLPLASENAKESQKNMVEILKALGVYMTVVRDMLLSLESKLLRNTEVQETMKKEREQEKTGEMSEEERRRINQEFKEYKEILRQIDAQLVYEKDPKKREELLKIRASVIGTNNKTNNNKKNNKTTTNQLKRNNIE